MKISTAHDLLFDLLTDLCQMQVQLGFWLVSFREKATHKGLRHLINKHHAETGLQLNLLAQAFERHSTAMTNGPSRAMNVILAEVDESVKFETDPEKLDLLLVIHFLRIEQFEITSYEIAASVAEQMGYHEEVETLADFLVLRDSSSGILRQLQIEMLQLTFPTETYPSPIFST